MTHEIKKKLSQLNAKKPKSTSKTREKVTFKRRLARLRRKAVNVFHRFYHSPNRPALFAELASTRNDTWRHPAHVATVNRSPIPNTTITISIVLFNSEKWLQAYFQSLINQKYPLNRLALSIVDNGSTDSTVDLVHEFLEKYGSRFLSVSLSQSTNVGFGRGHNIACKGVRTEFILISNVDLEFLHDSIENAVRYAVFDEEATAGWELMQIPFEHPKYYDPITLKCSWNAHACFLIRTKIFHKVGGYHTSIFMYGEDVEISARLREAGYNIKYLPFAQAIHHSYENENTFKPLQYKGAIFTAIVVRLRYGSFRDIVGMFFLIWRLLEHTTEPSRRKLALRAIREAGVKAPRFLWDRITTRGKRGRLAFAGFDYEIVRDGAFVETPPVTDRGMVSIIVRTYQGRLGLLKQSIASILNQSYQNYEIIVVEDKGNTLARFVDELKTFYPRLRLQYVRAEGNGRVAAGNTGLKHATGKFLMFLDDDDFLFGDHLNVLVNKIESAKAAYSYAWDVKTIMLDKQMGRYLEKEFELSEYFRRNYSRERIMMENFIPIQSIIFKRELYDQYGGFDPTLDLLEDWNLWARYSRGGAFTLVPKLTSCYRTPADKEQQAQRTELFDAAYPLVLKKNREIR